MSGTKLLGIAVLMGFIGCAPAYGMPAGGSVVAGNAVISQTGSETQINQTSDKAIINWQSFDTAPTESVKFFQPSSSSIALNRITSGLPTKFEGLLNANGQVFIVNPAGVLFTSTSRINVGGLLATTMDIKNNDFMNGNYQFYTVPGFEESKIINNGEINTISDNGLVALVAPGVENNGIIKANVGKVVLASGSNFTLDLYGDNLIQFAVPNSDTKVSVANNGYIQANNGQVLLTANAAEKVVNNVISMNGVIEANNATQGKNGVIILGGSGGVTKVSGKIKSNKIIIKSHDTVVDGELDAGDHGYIETSGDIINLNNIKINMTNGTWLIDPTNINVTPALAASISAQLTAGSDVTLNTNSPALQLGDITVNAPITSIGIGNLNLIADHSIVINQPINIGGSLSLQVPNSGPNNVQVFANITTGGDYSVGMASPAGIYNQSANVNAGGNFLINMAQSVISGAITAGGNLEIAGPVIFNSSTVQANGTQQYDGYISFGGQDMTLTGSSLNFLGRIDGLGNFTINGDATFQESIGMNGPLAGLTVNGSTNFRNTDIHANNQIYNGNFLINFETIMDGISIVFNGTLNGMPGTQNLNITTDAGTFFNNSLGNITPIASLVINGPTHFNASTNNALKIITIGNQDYNSNVFFETNNPNNSTIDFIGNMINFAGPTNQAVFINGTEAPEGSSNLSYNNQASVTFPFVKEPTTAIRITDDFLLTLAPVIAQASIRDPLAQQEEDENTTTDTEEGLVSESKSKSDIEVLVENPLPKNVAGTVFCMMGFATAIDNSGSERILLPGDKVYMDEKVITDTMSQVKIHMNSGKTVDVKPSEHYSVQG